MSIPLQVLLLEDREEDARLILHQLQQAGFDPRWRRVDTEADYVAALDPSLEVILADFHVPGWDTMEALAILQVRAWDIPFIIVSGTIGEDTAVAAMRNGAADYLIKDRLARLGPAVKRALEGRRLREEKRTMEAVRSTERRQAEEQLRQAELKYRNIFEHAIEGIYQTTPEGRFLAANPALARILGYASAEELIAGRTDIARQGYAEPAQRDEFKRRLEQDGVLQGFEYETLCQDGSRRWVSENARAVRDAQGGVLYYEGSLKDITERKRAEVALRESGEKFSKIFRNSPNAILVTSFDGRIVDANESFARLTGFTREEALGRTTLEIGFWIPPSDRAGFIRQLRHGGRVENMESQLRHRSGAERTVLISAEQMDLGGERMIIGEVLDITAREQTEAALRTEKKFSEQLVESLPGLFYLFRHDGRTLRWNRALETILEYTSAEVAQLQALDFIAPEDHERARQSIGETLATGRGEIELLVLTKSGQRVPYVFTSHRFMVQGQPCVLGTGIDISERRRAEEQVHHLASFPELNPNPVLEFAATGTLNYFNPAALEMARQAGHPDLPTLLPPETRELVAECLATGQPRLRLETKHGPRTLSWSFYPIAAERVVHCYVGDITERLHLEEQFRQSQKMQAIGQLAGGVAHDFNNILTVIHGYGSLLLMTEPIPAATAEAAQQIVQAAERAANLTRQLLAFSRRQIMQSRRLDLNDVITSLAKMLQRILGEDVRLQLNLHPRPLLTHADAGMLDQVLLNLVVNARDAMPEGGRLVIETAERNFTEEEAGAIPEATPGRHVGLRITDTGSGISPENLSRIFEPFFTTKEPGKGTGLGLATVFGIVKQHGGSLTVESEVGQGTTFQIYLPATEAAGPSPEDAAAKTKPRGGTETILVVEDEFAVRMLNRVVLERAGYRILEAPDGVEALRVWEQHQDSIRLLLTDIVMPEGVSGRDLAARLQARNPRLRVIFTSGYSADIAGRELSLQEGQNFIQKPSSPQQLLETVRRCLES